MDNMNVMDNLCPTVDPAHFSLPQQGRQPTSAEAGVRQSVHAHDVGFALVVAFDSVGIRRLPLTGGNFDLFRRDRYGEFHDAAAAVVPML